MSSWSAAAQEDEVPTLVRKRLLLVALDDEPGVGDHLEVCRTGLTFARKIVAQKDRVGQVERQRLERSQMDLTTAGDPNLDVGKDESKQRQHAQAALRGELPFAPEGCALEGNQEVDWDRVRIHFAQVEGQVDDLFV